LTCSANVLRPAPFAHAHIEAKRVRQENLHTILRAAALLATRNKKTKGDEAKAPKQRKRRGERERERKRANERFPLKYTRSCVGEKEKSSIRV
jgi:hypothetical protein